MPIPDPGNGFSPATIGARTTAVCYAAPCQLLILLLGVWAVLVLFLSLSQSSQGRAIWTVDWTVDWTVYS